MVLSRVRVGGASWPLSFFRQQKRRKTLDILRIPRTLPRLLESVRRTEKIEKDIMNHRGRDKERGMKYKGERLGIVLSWWLDAKEVRGDGPGS